MKFLSCYLFALVLLAVLCFGRIAADDKKDEPLKLSKEEQALLDLINQGREKEKLPALKPHPLLFKAARAHSENMAKQGKLSHNLEDKNVKDRTMAAGYKSTLVAETIGAGRKLTPQGTYNGWMNSRLHKEIMLDKLAEDAGIGIARDAKGEVYYTLVVGAEQKEPKKSPE